MSNVDLLSLVRDKVKKLKAYKVENYDCDIKLHANENPFSPPAELMESFRKSLEDFKLNRYPDPHCNGLKRILSQRWRTPPETLVVGNGSDELIQLILQIFCDMGDAVAFPDPTFAMYSIIAEGMGLKPVVHPLDENWDFKADEFLGAVEKHDPKILFFSFPNNPTGNCFSPEEIKKTIERFRGIVVVDEAYYDFSKKTFIHDIRGHNNLIVLRSLSKIGLAGLRVGYGVADPLIIDQINKVRLPYNSNTVSQTFSEKVLGNFSQVQEQIDTIIQERERLVRALSKIKSLKVYPSASNFILFRMEHDAGTVFKKLMDKGILIRDLSSHPRLKGCLRVTVGSRDENDQFLLQIENLTRAENLTT
ncbi:MAG: histidinol-phosphate transaminase [Nitrospinae bacterium]|nr:histidinol-phosphate transaminase [Nitrospinota bacterium]